MIHEDFAQSAIALLKHKDVIRRKIKDIVEKSESEFEIVYADKKIKLVAQTQIAKPFFGTIVCEHTKSNLDALVENWDAYIKAESTILFLDQKTGAHWTVTPHIHQRICGDGDVRKGLKAIYSNI